MMGMHFLSGATEIIVAIAAWGALLFAMTWAERKANATPLGAGRWSRIGFGCSFILSLVVVLPFLNQRSQDGPVEWYLLLGGAALIAVPCLLAAARIAWMRR